MAHKKGSCYGTSYGRKYEVLAGPFAGNNGTFYVIRDKHDQEVILMHANLLDGLKRCD